MAIPLLRSRTGCALHGALYTAAAIPGVVPVIHSTTGCGFQALQLVGGDAAASSNLSEKQIVFGGTSRLREQLKNTIQLVEGELHVVLSGCAAEMIGDDSQAMVKEVRDQGETVIDVGAAGFHGSAHHGYGLFLNAIIARHSVLAPRPEGGIPGLINILGLVPRQDAFWLADLEELSRMIAGIGLHPNALFGPDGGVQGLRDLARAQLTLVVSPWGVGPARELERQFGIPWLETDGLPVGADASAALLLRLDEVIGADLPALETFLAAETRREAYGLDLAAEAFFRQGPQPDFAVVAGSLHAPGLTRFLTGTLGWRAHAMIVTDNPPPESRTRLTAEFPEIRFSEDAGEIEDILRDSDAEIILGSDFERLAAAELGLPFVEVSFPTRRLGLAGGHGGFRGGLTLVEEIGRARSWP